MSKKNRGHASSLSELSTITQEQPAETAVAEIAENILATDASDLLDTRVDHAILTTSADEAVAIIDAMVAEEEAAVPDSEYDVPSADASSLIACLQAKIAALKESKSKRVASGSKPRPNVTYTLLNKPPAWSSTPQVAQLQQILFAPAFLAQHAQADGSVKLSEPDLFAAIVAGAESGVLRTKQEPIRIFQYYRSNLLNANCLHWA